MLPAYFPFGQSQHIVDPVISRNKPGGHIEQIVDAASAENQPLAHFVHGELPVGENSPALQLIRPANANLTKQITAINRDHIYVKAPPSPRAPQFHDIGLVD